MMVTTPQSEGWRPWLQTPIKCTVTEQKPQGSRERFVSDT